MNTRKSIFALASLASAALFAATPQIAQNRVTLRQDANSRLVTIAYEIEDAPGIVTADIQTNRGDGVYCSIGGEYLTTMYGDVNTYQGVGQHTIHWQPDLAWPNHKISLVEGGVRAVVTAWATNCPPTFAAVDLVVPGSVRFYANAESVPYGITNNLYKTDVLLMRKIPAGGVRWRMGSPSTEAGRSRDYELPRYVTLTKDFYIGVYMVTQMQYKRLGLTLPKNCIDTASADSSCHPVNAVSWNDIRGSDSSWPSATPLQSIGGTSLMASFRQKAGGGLAFDLPTSAQWEYACRAGTFTAYNNGSDTNVDEVAWYSGNQHAEGTSYTWAVGLKKKNAWDLYDMHGLHYEWCLDWYARTESSADEIDPNGPQTGASRIARGGTYRDDASQARSAFLTANQPTYTHSKYSFRVCAPAVYFAPAAE